MNEFQTSETVVLEHIVTTRYGLDVRRRTIRRVIKDKRSTGYVDERGELWRGNMKYLGDTIPVWGFGSPPTSWGNETYIRRLRV